MYETRLYGPIGGFGIDPQEFLDAIPKGEKEIKVRIHSPGGSVGDGLAIYHGLRDHPAHVVTVVDGYAASSASFVMLAGDEIQVHRNSMLFIHDPWTQAVGNSRDLRKAADDLDEHARAILDIYQMRTGKDAGELRALMEDERFFRGAEAVAMGFADSVLDDPEEEAQIAAMMSLEQLAGDISMSRQKTRREIEDEYAAILTRFDELTNAHNALINDQTDAIASAVAERDNKISELTNGLSVAGEQINALIAERDLAQDELTHAQAEVELRKGEADAATKAKADADAKLAVAVARLADPSFVDAEAQAAKSKALATADAEADEAEAKALAAAESAKILEPTTVAEIYESMEAGPERQEYWNKNKRSIIRELAGRE